MLHRPSTLRFGFVHTSLLAALLGVAACGGGRHAPATAPAVGEPETPPGVAAPVLPPSLDGPGSSQPRIAAVVAATDRDEADRALDAGRHPAQLLSFFQIAEGMEVADLFAGGGYTTELLARVVGPTGRVYAQNSRFVLERFAQVPWSTRLQKPVMNRVVRVDAELDAPLPEGVTDLDAVLFVLAYHDSVWMEVDRAAMNRAIFAALKPGGIYGVVDHAAATGHGVQDAQTLHRIERDVVVDEALAAGFVLDGEAPFLRNPRDTLDWSAAPGAAGERRGTSDRFVLRFVKPSAGLPVAAPAP